ncbi:hypothetical protein [Phenylobacterium sp.]|jgi:hypothetical protein|uniref:hypothetical protein n=1 Tax=Phenylobacterium sp. TaxID=1871053 RepID=UPI0037CB62F7
MTATTPDRGADMLAELAEMDLSAAKHIHAQLLAATEADEVADLSRSYQRASRCVRQTLALKAKLAHEGAGQARSAWTSPRADELSRRLHGFAVDDRTIELQHAVDRVILAEHPEHETTREALITRLDREIDDWVHEPDFVTRDLDAHVLYACRALGLDEGLARQWRDLPEADFDPPEQDLDDPGAAMPGETRPDISFNGQAQGVGEAPLTRASGRVDTG